MIQFTKMHGLGNDFVLVDCRKNSEIKLSKKQIQQLSNRRRGIGFDQIIFIRNSEKADVFMDMYNANGEMIEACGNGTRCLAGYLMDEKNTNNIMIQSHVDILKVKRTGENTVVVNMGKPSIPKFTQDVDTQNLPLSLSFSEEKTKVVGVSIGNPHTVFFVKKVSDIALKEEGQLVENNPLFSNKTNVEFVEKLDSKTLRMRVWERGTGITEACGTGACASFVASELLGLISKNDKISIILDGGTLEISYNKNGEVLMNGEYAYVFSGKIKMENI